MKDELQYIGETIVRNHILLSQNLEITQGKGYIQVVNKANLKPVAMQMRRENIKYFGQLLSIEPPKHEHLLEKIEENGKKAAKLAVEHNFSLSVSIRAMYSYRKVIWKTVEDIVEKKQFSAIVLQGIAKTIEPVFDELNAIYVETFDMYSRKIILEKETAEKANLAKSEFLSKMSHELRTPLNGILGFAQMLEMDDSLSKQQIDFVNEILSGGRHLLSLIDELLDLSSIEIGQLKISSEETVVTVIANECLRMVGPMAMKKNIKIIKEFNHLNSTSILVDPKRLKQILLNLLNNAIKYTNENGYVKLSSNTENNHLIIHIKDTGKGFSEEEYTNIFEPFYRNGYTKEKGIGIGLSIVKQLVSQMGGKLGLSSEVGKGSDFWVTFPICKLDKENETVNGKEYKDVEGKGITPFQVLYIEDNESNLHLVSNIFKTQQLTLLTANNGIEGIHIAETETVHLILLDLNLPDISGEEVYQALQKNKKTRQIPIIALSANAMEKDIKEVLNMGFSAYITKPIDVQDFLSTLSKFFRDSKGVAT